MRILPTWDLRCNLLRLSDISVTVSCRNNKKRHSLLSCEMFESSVQREKRSKWSFNEVIVVASLWDHQPLMRHNNEFIRILLYDVEMIVIYVVIVLLKHAVILAYKGTSVDIPSQCCHYPHVIHSVVFEFWWINNVIYRNILTVITFF